MTEPALHPRNRDFRWTMPAGPYRLLDVEQARAWEQDGYFLLRDAFTSAEVADVLAALDPLEARVADLLHQHPDGKIFIAEDGNITFTLHPMRYAPVLRRLCRHRVLADLAHDVIGPDVRLYWDQAVYKKPERPRTFPWHQDNGYTYLEPQQYLTCWVALTDATLSNGCPWVAPRLHRRGTLAHRLTEHGWQCLDDDPADATAVEAPAGSIVVFSSLTPHKTGPNVSGAVRKAYIIQFAPDGARAWRDGAEPEAQNDSERQFPVLIAGRRVEDDVDA